MGLYTMWLYLLLCVPSNRIRLPYDIIQREAKDGSKMSVKSQMWKGMTFNGL